MSAPAHTMPRRWPVLLSPALAVMNRLTYPQKFALISLLFALPLGFVIYHLIREIHNQIEFAQKEIQGTQYLRPLRRLYEHTEQSQLLAHNIFMGRVAERPKLIQVQTAIDEDMAALRAVEQELGQILRTTSKYEPLRENRRFLREKLLQLEPTDCETLHQQQLAEIRALALHVGDTSNLILDPDLDSYYLMDTVLLKLPQCQELLVQARLYGRKYLAAAATLTAEQRAELTRLAGLLRSNLEETRHGMEVAFRENPAGTLKPSLDVALRRHLADTEALLHALDNGVLKSKALAVAPAEYDRLVATSQQANYDFWDRSIKELDGLLQARCDGFAAKRQQVILVAILALVLVAYLWVAFYVAVMRTVRRLREASERMLGGSLDHFVALETRDELGQVATSFNNIAIRLRAEWQQAQDESARAHAASEQLRQNQQELERAKEAAEHANRTKSIFLATMSHEIRTPLNAVLGMASLLQDTELNTQQQEFARVIRTSGEALLGVINDILDFSKIEAGDLELEQEPFDLRACVEGALDVVAVRGAEKGLDLACQLAPETPAWIVGDVTRLRQILINLLSNAVKFTEKGEVVISVEMAAPAPPDSSAASCHLQIAVRDTGIGIPADRINRLFQSFSQVDASTTRKYGGTGLGLAISKRLAEMMGGTMTVTSTHGKGSTFTFSITAARADTPVAEPGKELANLPDPASKRLLIVDDNETNRRIVALVTQGWGFQTRETGSPLEALRWLEEGEQFDLGILDIAMPEMDGLTLAATIRQRPATAKLPLVAFTSLTRREAFGDRREFDAFVTKPLKPALLLEVLINLFTGQAVQRGERSKKQEFDSTLGQRLPLRLLVADDVPANQQMLGVMLGRMGYKTEFADDGREVLRALERTPFDLIFMDMQMPVMDGLDCTRELVRRYPSAQRPKIVALTANVSAEDARECRAAGMDDFLTKPVKALELRQCLEQWGQTIAAGGSRSAAAGTSTQGSASPPGTSHDVDLIDDVILSDLRELDADEPGLLRSFVDGLRQAIPEHVALMQQALAAGDGEQLRKVAHRLKGTAANVAACGVAAQCHALETIGRSGVLTEGAALLAELERRFAQTEAFFAQLNGKAQ